MLETTAVVDRWAIEVDRATESLPTLRRKLRAYLQLVAGGELGPDGAIFPRVLLTVPDERRLKFLRQLVAALPPPATSLFAVVHHAVASQFVLQVLRE